MNSHIKKCICPYNHMSAGVETSFFCPKNIGFFNSKLGWLMQTEQLGFQKVFCHNFFTSVTISLHLFKICLELLLIFIPCINSLIFDEFFL